MADDSHPGIMSSTACGSARDTTPGAPRRSSGEIAGQRWKKGQILAWDGGRGQPVPAAGLLSVLRQPGNDDGWNGNAQ